MKIIGNALWFLFCGLILGLIWLTVGVLWCITIIGIPVGVQCFKLSALAFFPFGKEITFSTKTSSFLLNLFWLLFGGFEIAVLYVIFGILFAITIIGIPFTKQCFKLAKLALIPFGAEIH